MLWGNSTCNRFLIPSWWFLLGWLEPLLDIIARNSTHVVSPLISNIRADNFAIETISLSSFFVGGFSWNLKVSLCEVHLEFQAFRLCCSMRVWVCCEWICGRFLYVFLWMCTVYVYSYNDRFMNVLYFSCKEKGGIYNNFVVLMTTPIDKSSISKSSISSSRAIL